MKKIFALLLCVILTVSILPAGVVSAAQAPCFELSDATVSAGDTAVITLSLKNNPGICSAYLDISYDTNLELLSVRDTGLLKGALFEEDISDTSYTLSWDDSLAAADNLHNGVIAELTFKVGENAPNGKYSIDVSYDSEEVYNSALQNVSFLCDSATVIVRNENISENEHFFLHNGNLIIRPGTAVEEVLPYVPHKSSFFDVNGKPLSDKSAIMSGAVLRQENGGEYVCIVLGECNGDGKISSSDARFALRASVFLEEPEVWQINSCDIDNSGSVTSSDARNILRGSVFLEKPESWYENKKTSGSLMVLSDENYEDAYEFICEGIKKLKSGIDISVFHLSRSEVKEMLNRIIYENPDFFYAEHFSYTYTSSHVLRVNVTYTDNAAEKRQNYESLIKEITDTVDRSWSDFEIILYLHDYLCRNFEYDTNHKIFDSYNFLVKKKGVCQAYSLAYMDLLQRFDIPVRFVKSDRMEHSWNVVQLDSKWYHVDVTWDDPTPDRFGSAHHNNFLLSDEGIINASTDKHRDWEYAGDAVACNSKKYDTAFWHGVNTPFAYLNGSWFYIAKNGNGYSLFSTRNFMSSVAEKNLSGRWPSRANSYWIGYYSGLGIYDNMLIFNTPDSVIAFDPATKTEKVIHTKNDALYIYGLKVGDAVYYSLQSRPDEAAKKIIKLDIDKKGDVNKDSNVNAKDYTVLIRYLNGYSVSFNKNAADFDKNGTVNKNDASLLRKFIVNS